ncbi:MAG: hypothetical protein WCK29_00060 [archaeon]
MANQQARVRSMESTESALASLTQGDLAVIQTEDSKIYSYTFIGPRSGNELRFARRTSSDTISRLSFAPSDVSLYTDQIYRGKVIQSNVVKGGSIEYLSYDEILRRFNR